MAETKPRRRTLYATVEVDVSLDEDMLHDNGWHHEEECGGDPDSPGAEWPTLSSEDVRSLGTALASLHRQAHPSQAASVRLCREEPCRSLGIDQVREVDGA